MGDLPINTGAPDALVTVLLSEYEALKAEQRSRIGTRDNLLYATLTAIAAIATVTVAADRLELLLLLPLAATVLGWTHLANDHLITEIGRYMRDGLGPRLASLVAAADPTDTFGAGGPMFGWELEHRGDRYRGSRRRLQLGVNLLAFCLPPLAGLVVVAAAGPHTAAVLAVCVVELAVVAVLAWQIVRYAGGADLRRVRA